MNRVEVLISLIEAAQRALACVKFNRERHPMPNGEPWPIPEWEAELRNAVAAARKVFQEVK